MRPTSTHAGEEHRSWIDVPLQSALRDWRRHGGALYGRLATSLSEAIEAGDLPAGRNLPPERILASYLGIGRRTVARAYESLSERSLVVRRQGAGTRVTGPLVRLDDDRAAKRTTALQRNIVFGRLDHGAAPVIDLLSVYAPGGTAMAAQTLRDAAASLEELAGSHHGYTPAGFGPLREAIAARYSEQGIPTAAEQIIITSGAQQATSLIASDLVADGQTAVVEDPTVPGAIDVFRTTGARLLTVPVGRSGTDPDVLERTLRGNAVGVAYLVPTYQSPTGTVMPAGARRRVAEIAAETEVPIVEDTTLAELSITGDPPPPIARYAGDAPVLTIGSLSKLFWAGLRIGWVRGPRETIAHLGRLKAVTDLGTSLIPQAVALHILGEVDAQRAERRAEMAAKLDDVEAQLRAGFPGWTWERPAGGLCLWVRLPRGSALEFTQVAYDHGVAVAPGTIASAFDRFDDHLRIPFGYEPAVTAEALRRLAGAWREYDHRLTPASA